MPRNKTTAKKTTTKGTTARKVTARTSSAGNVSMREAAGKTAANKTKAKNPAATKITAGKTTKQVKRGDLIVIDSPKVGSQAREGEVLQVLQGGLSVSYRIRWTDGNETLISPVLGSARFVRP